MRSHCEPDSIQCIRITKRRVLRQMPKQVDHEERRREIATAVLRLVTTRGVEAASLRTVPQSSAKSALHGFSSPVPSLVNVCPPTVKEFSHEIATNGFTPPLSSAAADTMVN